MFDVKTLAVDGGKYSSLLMTKEKNLLIYNKSDTNKELYKNFNDQFSLFLNKFPNNILKEKV